MEEDRSGSSRRSTRAQAAPEWTSAETLTLIREISAFDRDCGGSVASFQKWKTVSKSLSADGLRRSLDECRRKWASLLDAFNKVKELGSFWNLDDEVRKEVRISEDFDLEVFRAMDGYLNGQDEEEGERQSGGEGTDHEGGGDHDGENGLIEDYEEEAGFEKKRYHPMIARSKKRSIPETVNKPQKLKESTKKKKNPQIAPTVILKEEDEELNLLNEQTILLATNHYEEEEEEEEEEEDDEQVLAEKLLEHAKLIEAIVKRTPSVSDDACSADSREAETEFVRDQADQLITHLGKLAQTLDQLCDCPIMSSTSV